MLADRDGVAAAAELDCAPDEEDTAELDCDPEDEMDEPELTELVPDPEVDDDPETVPEALEPVEPEVALVEAVV